ncbi:MAG: adenine deaminase [Bacteroidales bacterium]
MNFSVKGNFVDIWNQAIYGAELFSKEGRISEIKRLDQKFDSFIMPGLIDAHVHIESSMLVPSEFARLAVRHGTVATVSDPHEIANVLGVEGVNFMIENGKKVNFKFHFGAPSCVPATPFETSGAVLNSKDINNLLLRDEVSYLSEMMNFPGVLHQDEEVVEKLKAAKRLNKCIDGHAPGLTGGALYNYINAGITTDHECNSLEEAEEKIKLGMKIQIREGSAAKNFDALTSLIDKYPASVMLCTDDSHPDDLLDAHIIDLIKRGITKDLNIFNLIKAATLNPCEHYKLKVGLLRVDDPADFIIVNNLTELKVLHTYINGVLVYENGISLIPRLVVENLNNFNCSLINEEQIRVYNKGGKIRVIEALDGDLYTKSSLETPKVVNDSLVSDINRDILKIVVVNRYTNEPPQVGFIKNFGLKNGAVAQSIAHDSHNIIAVGVSDSDIVNAINLIVKNKGGISFVENKTELFLPLPVAGIMTALPGEEVAKKYRELNNKVKEKGSNLSNPLMTLSFMALLVIPELKIGNKGLFDVQKFSFVSLFE